MMWDQELKAPEGHPPRCSRWERLHWLLQSAAAYALMNLADDVALLALMFC